MTNTLIDLSEDAFDALFPLRRNHLNPNASWGDAEPGGCLFETHGPELDFVKQQDVRTVWTFVDGDEDDQYVVSGFHRVNRIGYLISTVPLPDGVEVQVRVPMQTDSDLSE